MRFSNKFNIDIFNIFEERYSSDINKLYPEVETVVIDVYDKASGKIKDYITHFPGFGVNTVEDKSAEINNPFQCFPHFYYNVECEYYDDIIMVDSICKSINLDENEQLALIGHEIGHFIYCYKGVRDFNEEEFADQIACKLGLSSYLKTALDKCLLLGQNQESIKKRIAKL